MPKTVHLLTTNNTHACTEFDAGKRAAHASVDINLVTCQACRFKHAERDGVKRVSVLSIDAWRFDGGWTWNQWYRQGEAPIEVCDFSPRDIFAWMRKEGYLSSASSGKVVIDDDQYNVVICERSTGRPLFAIAYGEAQDDE